MSDNKRRRAAKEEDELMQTTDISDEQVEMLKSLELDMKRATIISSLEAERRLQPVYQKRRKVLAGIPHFWPMAMKNHSEIIIFLQVQEDMDALGYLKDIYVDRDPVNLRAFTLEFHFDENPYFSDAVLKKELRLYKHDGAEHEEPDADGLTKSILAFNPERDIQEQTIKINWKDDKVNLTKKYPRHVRHGDEDTDEMMMAPEDEFGSFFHLFEMIEAGSDIDLAHTFADDLYPEAVEYFQGGGTNSIYNEDSGESDEDSEDDDDDASEIDLEKPRPSKRKH